MMSMIYAQSTVAPTNQETNWLAAIILYLCAVLAMIGLLSMIIIVIYFAIRYILRIKDEKILAEPILNHTIQLRILPSEVSSG